MAEIATLTLADALCVVSQMREEDRHGLRAVLGPISDELIAVNRWQTEGPAWVLLQDNEPAAIFGLSMQGQWCAVAWLIARPVMRPESWRKLMRHCATVRSNAQAAGLHRIEAQVFSQWAAALKFARRLGFEFEGVRRKAGRHGEDLHMWSIVRGE